jgi:carbon starvation protein
MTSFIIFSVILFFLLAYRFYGGWLQRRWGVDAARPTPAHTHRDDLDYVPTPMPVLFGHHFASIAGAAPIIGPIAASVFGWLPVVLWIVIAGIFFGSVHDFGSLFASVRHQAKPLSQVIGEHIGASNQRFFAWFVWLTSILVIAAFTSIVADSFVAMPSAGTASALFMALAVAFGFFRRRTGASLAVSTIIALTLMAGCIYLGFLLPLVLAKSVWMLLIILYIGVASVTPVWALLQPRDYLNSFLLYALIVSAALGLLFLNPAIEMAPFTAFRTEDMPLFPLLFVMVACGAISGYHSMFASTTTSKQVNNERDIRPVAMGGMLVESLLAVIALLTAASLPRTQFSELYQHGGPITIFSSGLAALFEKIHVPTQAGASFVVLAISSFALTSLDSVARVARTIIQDIVGQSRVLSDFRPASVLRTPVGATAVTVSIGGAAAFARWQSIWPVFGCANQLIAALALITLFVWLKKSGRVYFVVVLPMTFMFIVASSGLVQLTLTSFRAHHLLLATVALLLLVLSLAFLFGIIRPLIWNSFSRELK